MLAEVAEALSAVVLAVHHDVGESVGEAELGLEEGQLERAFEVRFGEGGDPGQFLLVRGAEALDQVGEGGERLHVLLAVEGTVEHPGHEIALDSDDVEEGRLQPLVLQRGRVGVNGGEQGSVGPGLIGKEVLEVHGAMIAQRWPANQRLYGALGMVNECIGLISPRQGPDDGNETVGIDVLDNTLIPCLL